MQNRRFTRLTNAFSKKAENHAHAVSSLLHVLQLLSPAPDAYQGSGWHQERRPQWPLESLTTFGPSWKFLE